MGLVVSNGCTLSHLAVLESGATPTRRKGLVGRVCVRCCSNYFILRRYLIFELVYLGGTHAIVALTVTPGLEL